MIKFLTFLLALTLFSCSDTSQESVLSNFSDNKAIYESIVLQLETTDNISFIKKNTFIVSILALLTDSTEMELIGNEVSLSANDIKIYNRVLKKLQGLDIWRIEVLKEIDSPSKVKSIIFLAPFKYSDEVFYSLHFFYDGHSVYDYMSHPQNGCSLLEDNWYLCAVNQ